MAMRTTCTATVFAKWEYFVLSYLVRQDRCRFDAKYMRAKEDEFLCVTADNSSVTRDKQV
ncbi:TPA: hypothetical protein KLD18_002723 [Legionella pneumophila]|nr:hypothetical protein [Legionella pneumophila]